MARTATVNAPGKINLTLEILSKREDGYHDLRSVLLPISLYETITVTERDDGQITLETVGDGVDTSELGNCPPEKNLAVKAAWLMKDISGTSKGCHIHITKRVPIGAGMAGGSADAAGTMEALRALWLPNVDRKQLVEPSAMLGSDIPGLLYGGAILMEGRGEIVTPIFEAGEKADNCFWLVVAFPGVAISTKNVYQNCIPCLTDRSQICDNAIYSVRKGDVRAACRYIFNGLQDTVFNQYPETKRFYTALGNGGALSQMLSGSGSAVFGLAESKEHALKIQSLLPEGTWSKVVQTLPDSVMAAHGPLTP